MYITPDYYFIQTVQNKMCRATLIKPSKPAERAELDERAISLLRHSVVFLVEG